VSPYNTGSKRSAEVEHDNCGGKRNIEGKEPLVTKSAGRQQSGRMEEMGRKYSRSRRVPSALMMDTLQKMVARRALPSTG
jgi:hypothetical protein